MIRRRLPLTRLEHHSLRKILLQERIQHMMGSVATTIVLMRSCIEGLASAQRILRVRSHVVYEAGSTSTRRSIQE